MATTTNYGWTTPDDTALVKDGAAAIRTLGTSIDTTTKNLNPSTTLGDIEYRSSTANTNTRLGIGSTGQVLTVSGGVPTWAAAGGGFTFTTWSPTYTNMTIGNGTVVARYATSGKFTYFEFSFILGSTSSISGYASFTLPTTPKNYTGTDYATNIVLAGYMDFQARYWDGRGEIRSDGCRLNYTGITSTKGSREPLSSTEPLNWANTDSMFVCGSYEEA